MFIYNPKTSLRDGIKSAFPPQLFPWDDYYAPAFLYYLQDGGVSISSSFKPFAISTKKETAISFDRGTLVIPVKGCAGFHAETNVTLLAIDKFQWFDGWSG